jgi:hypothetical protein
MRYIFDGMGVGSFVLGRVALRFGATIGISLFGVVEIVAFPHLMLLALEVHR